MITYTHADSHTDTHTDSDTHRHDYFISRAPAGCAADSKCTTSSPALKTIMRVSSVDNKYVI